MDSIGACGALERGSNPRGSIKRMFFKLKQNIYNMFLHSTKEDFLLILKDIGSVLLFLSPIYLVPFTIALYQMEAPYITFSYLYIGVFQATLGFILWKKIKTDLKTTMKHAFVEISLLWLVLPLFFAYPYVSQLGVNILDAYFEMMSAITTTGLTLFTPYLEQIPDSLIFWRSFISWIGGIGIVVLALSSFFIKYTKASRMVIAEGHEDNIRANVKNTAKEIFTIYLFLTSVGVILLQIAGMPFFAAINYSMSAISTTGMDIAKNSTIYISNAWIELALIIIMIAGATSFSLHYLVFKRREFYRIFQDSEFMFLLFFGIFVALLNMPKLNLIHTKTFLDSLFHSFSALTCGGFALISPQLFSKIDEFVKITLIIAMYIGGSSGSTAGGVKISRILIFFKTIYWKIKEAVLPKNTIFPKIYENKNISDKNIREILQYLALYTFFILITSIVMVHFGNSFTDSIFETVSAQSNAGMSVGITENANDFIKVLLIINMIIGRLEILPLFALVGFIISYQRKG